MAMYWQTTADGGRRLALPVKAWADDGAIELVTTQLDVAPPAIARATELLSLGERHRARRFADVHAGRRFVAGRARLRQLLGERLGLAPTRVELACGYHGKPLLAGQHAAARLCFNLSHVGDMTVYAFGRGRQVGVDVEPLRSVAGADEILGRLSSSRERAEYGTLDAAERPLGFINWWTRKEAFTKALGSGLRFPLDAFDVTLAPQLPAQILRVGTVPAERCGWALHSFQPAPGLVGALVWRQSATAPAPDALSEGC